MKRCPGCQSVKDLSQFSRCTREADGLQVRCKACQSRYAKVYYKKEATKERIRAYYKKRIETDPEYRTYNRARCLKKTKEWYRANKQRALQYHKQWCSKNKDREGEYAAKRRAKMRGAVVKFTAKDWAAIKALYGNICLGCHRRGDEVLLTRDHIIPLSAGGTHTTDNIQPLCRSCNSKKGKNSIDYRINHFTPIHD